MTYKNHYFVQIRANEKNLPVWLIAIYDPTNTYLITTASSFSLHTTISWAKNIVNQYIQSNAQTRRIKAMEACLAATEQLITAMKARDTAFSEYTNVLNECECKKCHNIY